MRILATSRVRLMVPGEHVFAVPGLSLGDGADRGDAVELFLARLVASGMPPVTEAADLDTIRDVCTALDGMALAIELAAARVPSFGLDGLDRALTRQPRTAGARARSDDRHASLRATIDWSYQACSATRSRRCCGPCAVFASPFTLDAAADVLEMSPTRVLGVLGRLVDWNLVALRPGLTTRYRVLETIRQYATELSASRGELRPSAPPPRVVPR